MPPSQREVIAANSKSMTLTNEQSYHKSLRLAAQAVLKKQDEYELTHGKMKKKKGKKNGKTNKNRNLSGDKKTGGFVDKRKARVSRGGTFGLTFLESEVNATTDTPIHCEGTGISGGVGLGRADAECDSRVSRGLRRRMIC